MTYRGAPFPADYDGSTWWRPAPLSAAQPFRPPTKPDPEWDAEIERAARAPPNPNDGGGHEIARAQGQTQIAGAGPKRPGCL